MAHEHEGEMISMKLSAEESKQRGETAMADRPKYPYGLSINLENEAIEKLGLPALPAVGSTMLLYARVQVESVSERESKGEEKNRSIGLQITDMMFMPDQGGKKETEKVLYGG